MTRTLAVSLCVALTVFSTGLARADDATVAKHEVLLNITAPKQAARPAAPAVPQPETLLVLIRTSLVALNQAVQTGNFTVLRDLAAPAFRSANSPAQLGVIFAALRNRNIDLSPAVAVTPKLTEPPQVTKEHLLRLVGYFPTKPLQIRFQLLFQPVKGHWQLYGMAVDTAAPTVAMLPPQTRPALR